MGRVISLFGFEDYSDKVQALFCCLYSRKIFEGRRGDANGETLLFKQSIQFSWCLKTNLLPPLNFSDFLNEFDSMIVHAALFAFIFVLQYHNGRPEHVFFKNKRNCFLPIFGLFVDVRARFFIFCLEMFKIFLI